MATKPTAKLDWVVSNDAAKMIEPSPIKKALGYFGNDKPTYQQFNWFFNNIDHWLKYLETTTDDLGTQKVSKPLTGAAANKLLALDNAGTGYEYKTIAGTAPITVTHGAGLVTIASTAAAAGVAGHLSTGAQEIPGAKTFLAAGIFNSTLNVLGNFTVAGATIIQGNLEVQGTFTYLNVQDLQVEDKNIELNYGSTTAAASGAGLTVLGDSNTILTKMLYDPTLVSKWKIGAVGSESEIITVGGNFTATGRHKGNGYVPAGVISAFSGYSLPAYYYWCDGAAYLISTEPDLYAALTFTKSLTTTNASTSVTCASTADLGAGYAVYGTGIPAGAKIVSITNGTTFVISAAATASATVTGTIAPYDQQINPTTGTAWAAPATGYFRVPDSRSLHLRGVGTSNLGVAVMLGIWLDDATAQNGLTVSGGTSALTGTTTFASSTHTHTSGSFRAHISVGGSGVTQERTASGTWNGSHFAAATVSSGSYPGQNTGSLLDGTSDGPSATAAVGISSTAASMSAGDVETRPQSRGVNYIIKN